MSALHLAAVSLLAALAGAQDTIRLGTWNLEHFGARDPRRTERQVELTAEYIRGLGVDLLALQEIRTEDAIRNLTRTLGDEWSFVLGTTGRFSNDSGRISVGFVWNRDRLELLQAEELLELPSQAGELPIFHRKPVSAVFRARDGGFDFRAITVHLKASRGAKNEAKRVGEVSALREWIAALYERDGEDRDIVVLGDFNHTYRAPAHQRFTTDGVVEYLKADGTPRTIVHFEEPIDHVAITPGLREELVTGKVVVHGEDAARDLNAWRHAYSDHIPVTVELYARDNDPGATFKPVGPGQELRPDGGAAAPPRAARPVTALGVGSRVEVRYEDDDARMSMNGTLVTALGDWVQVADDSGRVIAIPRERVHAVIQLDARQQ